MLCPTLFIGIGSTGLDILERLQELVLEHYGRPSLDIFRYIAIETREAAEVKHPEWGESEIQLVRPVVRNTDALQAAVRAGSKSYLRDWLDPDLLKIPGRQFVEGASNIRMAGRLIFWENWETVRVLLSTAFNQVTSDENRSLTCDFLAQHYRRTGQPFGDKSSLVSGLPSVYIVGTLSGGTCSGMFIDIGYCIKEITGLWSEKLPNPNVAKTIGVFTLFDAATLTSASQQAVQGLAANCWAALREYDFWCHPETRYQVTFPTRLYPERKYDIDTNERPLDWLYALSCTATDTRNVVTSNLRKGGQPDLESLQHMASVVLFTESIGGLLAEKERIRTDYRGRERALRRNAAQHSPCIATCGVASFWHPLYRIAEGAACTYAAEVCEDWTGEVEPNERQQIGKRAASDWPKMITERLDSLTSSGTGTLISDLSQSLDRQKERLLVVSEDEFTSSLRAVLGQLNKGGKYDRHLGDSDRARQFVRGLFVDIAKKLNRVIDESGGIGPAETYLEQLERVIGETLAQIPSEYPSPDIGQLSSRRADFFARLLLRSRAIEKRYREESIAECRHYAMDQVKHIRNYRIRPLLMELRGLLGVESSLEGAKPTQESLKQRIDGIRAVLGAFVKEMRKRRGLLSAKVPHTQDVAVVSESESISIKDDIDRAVAHFKKSVPPDQVKAIIKRIKRGQSLSEFLNAIQTRGSTEELKQRFSEVLLRQFLEQSQTFDLVDHVVSAKTPAELADFARHALPHLELTPGESNLASTVIGRPVSMIVGRNANALQQVQKSLRGTACEGLFELTIGSQELSHMLFFYREEPLMFMDENMATAELFEGCYRAAERSSPYGLHCHKAGKIVYDPRIFERRKRTKEELLPIALKLMSVRDTDGNWSTSEVFRVERGKLVCRDVRKSGLKFRLSADADGAELCAQEAEIYDYLTSMVLGRLAGLSREEVVGRINSYLDWYEERAETLGDDPADSRSAEQEVLLRIPAVREKLRENDREDA